MIENGDVARSRKTVIFILPYKIQRKRLEDMKSSMTRKNISFTNSIDHTVTHVVTEFESLDQVDKQVVKDGLRIPEEACIVSTKWLVECLKASEVVPVLDCHKMKQVEKLSSDVNESRVCAEIPEWACQRGAKLEHYNQKLTDALEILQQYAELRDAPQDYPRALAFRRASCVLKSLSFTLKFPSQLAGLKDIGGHVQRVITDILDNGSSLEVEEIRNSHWFQQMKTFTGIFGVGSATAKNWIARGWETVEDVRKAGFMTRDWRLNWGLAFYEDLISPVSQQEAYTFTSIVQNEAEKILPGTIVTLTGGFRRGKLTGHDVDILITHPKEGEEIGLLPKLLSVLAKKDLILIGHREKNSYRPDVLYQHSSTGTRGQLDHFEKWLGICKFPKSYHVPGTAITADSGTDQIPFCSSETKIENISSDVENSPSELDEHADTCCGSSRALSQLNCSNNSCELSKVEGYVNCDDSFEDMFEPQLKKSKIGDIGNSLPTIVVGSQRNWMARRVDLIVSPYSQYYFALFGWTGSKHFNRDSRLFAQKILSMKLTSHGLYDMKQQKSLSASSEEDVFTHLQIPYRDPTDRNC